MTLIAITQIEVCLALGQAGDSAKGQPSMPPKTLSVAPGTLFIAADQDQKDQLVAMGAARVATAKDIKARDGDEVLDLTDVAAGKAAQKSDAARAEQDLARAAYLTAFGEEAHPQMQPAEMRGRIAKKVEADAKKVEADAKKVEAEAKKVNRDQQADK